jgi:hypothetical protein
MKPNRRQRNKPQKTEAEIRAEWENETTSEALRDLASGRAVVPWQRVIAVRVLQARVASEPDPLDRSRAEAELSSLLAASAPQPAPAPTQQAPRAFDSKTASAAEMRAYCAAHGLDPSLFKGGPGTARHPPTPVQQQQLDLQEADRRARAAAQAKLAEQGRRDLRTAPAAEVRARLAELGLELPNGLASFRDPPPPGPTGNHGHVDDPGERRRQLVEQATRSLDAREARAKRTGVPIDARALPPDQFKLYCERLGVQPTSSIVDKRAVRAGGLGPAR